MAGIHGSRALIYLSPDGDAVAPLAEQANYSIELDADIQDVTALGQTWGAAVKGINKWSGSADGNFDTGNKAPWTAGTSVASQYLYIYPQGTAATGQFYSGMCFVKLAKALAGGVTSKAASGFSFTGTGALSCT